ncbi:MAG: hypothetical protein KC621_29705 [Myxococcales bacterium]|nr:hypothetical protein [Myxococcales bacterium]
MMMSDHVWVVGELQADPARDRAGCTVTVRVGRGRFPEDRSVRVSAGQAELTGDWRRGSMVEIEARVVGARRSLVAHRVYTLATG